MNKFLPLIIAALVSLSTCNTMDVSLHPASTPIASPAPPAFNKAMARSMQRSSIVDASSTSDDSLSSSGESESDGEEWDRTVEGGLFEMSPPRKQKKALFDFVSNFMICFVLNIPKYMAHAANANRCAAAFAQTKASPEQANWIIQAITTNLLNQKREHQQMALQCAHFALEQNPANQELLCQIEAFEAKRNDERRARGHKASMQLLAALGDAY